MTADNPIANELPEIPEPEEPIYAGDLPAGCPPEDATAGEATFFAAHLDSPPCQDDFTTAYERNAYRKDPECERKCCSVMAKEEEARHLVVLVPKRYRYVSRGVVRAEHGVWKHSPEPQFPSHHSLWIVVGVRMHDIFTDVL